MENTITFASVTDAMRAREALRKHRIFSKLIRTPAKLRKGSCGYSLVIGKDFSKAVDIIHQKKLPYRGIFAGDEA